MTPKEHAERWLEEVGPLYGVTMPIDSAINALCNLYGWHPNDFKGGRQ